LREDLSVTRSQLLDARGRLRDSEAKFESVQQALARLEPLLELGPQSLRAAQRLHAAAVNHPRLYSALLKCVRPFQRRAG
jgi:hypothetical protein